MGQIPISDKRGVIFNDHDDPRANTRGGGTSLHLTCQAPYLCIGGGKECIKGAKGTDQGTTTAEVNMEYFFLEKLLNPMLVGFAKKISAHQVQFGGLAAWLKPSCLPEATTMLLLNVFLNRTEWNRGISQNPMKICLFFP